MPGCIPDQASNYLTCFNQNGLTIYPDTTINCELISSIHHLDNKPNQITIFPNPSNGSFYIDFKNLDVSEIKITDLLGKIIIQNKVIENKVITIENLDLGVYNLTLVNQEKIEITKKIIVCP